MEAGTRARVQSRETGLQDSRQSGWAISRALEPYVILTLVLIGFCMRYLDKQLKHLYSPPPCLRC